MANLCSFEMRLRGSHDNIEHFYNAMIQNGDIWMGRGADAEIEFEDEDCARITGNCKWSIVSALIDNAISMRSGSKRWYFGAYKPSEFITLWEACKKWSVDMEVYSEEGGCCFQEHFMCIDGEIVCEDCVNWEEYFVDDYETKEEAEEDLEIEITDEEWEEGLSEGRFTRGGFENWDFEI